MAATQLGYEVSVFDNEATSPEGITDRLRSLVGNEVQFIKGDLRNVDDIESAMDMSSPSCVAHFAGLKSVHEGERIPLDYYAVNLVGTLNLLAAMDTARCRKIIFSSSATVYGEPDYVPIDESHRVAPINTYGRTKLACENLINDWSRSASASAVALRYFNPVGAHPSGLIGEDPRGVPNNLIPYVSRVCLGDLEMVNVYGQDYGTRDGTGERDYIHVMDLIEGHLASLEYLSEFKGFEVFNLGTGSGTTVREIIRAYEEVSGQIIPVKLQPPRLGDVARSIADPSKANKVLNFSAKKSVEQMLASEFNWLNNKSVN